MAEKFKRWLVDDMEAGEGAELDADQTVEFGLDGKMYEIDLSRHRSLRLTAPAMLPVWTRCS